MLLPERAASDRREAQVTLLPEMPEGNAGKLPSSPLLLAMDHAVLSTHSLQAQPPHTRLQTHLNPWGLSISLL